MPAQNAALYPLKHRVVSPKGERAHEFQTQGRSSKTSGVLQE